MEEYQVDYPLIAFLTKWMAFIFFSDLSIFISDIDRDVGIVNANLKLCSKAAELIYEFDELLESTYEQSVYAGISSLFSLEESLLQLASSGEVDGIFGFVVMKSAQKNQCLARYVEFGCFDGAFR